MAGIRSVVAQPGWGGFVRLAAITGGGILVLQSTDSVDASKITYLLVAGAAILAAFLRLPSLRHTQAFAAMRPLLAAMIGLLVVIVISLPVSLAHGVRATDWLRDASAYALFALAALVALDAYGAHRRALVGLMLGVGALSTVAYVITWLDIRSIVDAPIDRLVLPSGALASMFLVATSSLSFGDRRRWLWWSVAAGVTLGLFLILGTRSRLPFVLLPVALSVVAGGAVRPRATTLVTQLGVAAVVVLALLGTQALAETTPSPGQPDGPTDVIGRRIGTIDDLVENPASDPSMRERLSQMAGSWRVFIENPIVGAGPGALISWRDYANREQATWTVDSPIAILSKFGLVGGLAGLFWIGAFAAVFARLAPRLRGSSEWLILVGESVVLAYAALFAPPMQDKGTGFALMLMVAVVLNRAFSPSRDSPMRA